MRLYWGGHVTGLGKKLYSYRILIVKSLGKRPLGRFRRRWNDNIEIDFKEICFENGRWVKLD